MHFLLSLQERFSLHYFFNLKPFQICFQSLYRDPHCCQARSCLKRHPVSSKVFIVFQPVSPRKTVGIDRWVMRRNLLVIPLPWCPSELWWTMTSPTSLSTWGSWSDQSIQSFILSRGWFIKVVIRDNEILVLMDFSNMNHRGFLSHIDPDLIWAFLCFCLVTLLLIGLRNTVPIFSVGVKKAVFRCDSISRYGIWEGGSE